MASYVLSKLLADSSGCVSALPARGRGLPNAAPARRSEWFSFPDGARPAYLLRQRMRTLRLRRSLAGLLLLVGIGVPICGGAAVVAIQAQLARDGGVPLLWIKLEAGVALLVALVAVFS